MKKILIPVLAVLASTAVRAQNPIITNQFTADPTARVFNGRLYLFPSHDIISPVEPKKKWFSMADYHMFSSTDLTEWTDHGIILSQEQVPWGKPDGYSMWAPDCVEKDGKYYFFFPDAPKEGRGFNIGVAIANNLFWPKFEPQQKPIEGVMGIDPCVLQTSKGESYLFWGGGGLVVAKMSDDLLSIEGKPQRIANLPEGFKEGPFAFERNGKFYLTYPWVREKDGTECLAYAMSDNPMGPYEYKGLIMKESKTGCWTNHHSIVEFNNQWYLFYHHNDYSPSFDKNRSVCVDSLFFNADGTIQEVIPTLRGVGVSDARKPVQIDRYSEIGGGASIDYLDKKNLFLGWKTLFPSAGAWVRYNKVNMKSSCAKNVCLRMKSSGKAVFTLSLGGFKTDLAVESTGDKWEDVNIETRTLPEGISDMTLTLKSADAPVEVDWVSLTNDPRPVYFKKPAEAKSTPDADGFIRRWSILEPEKMDIRSNVVFTDSYLKETFAKHIVPMKKLPADKQTTVVSGQKLMWHHLESNSYNNKLFRFSTMLGKPEYGVFFNVVTVINCAEDIDNVRLAVGSNGASQWLLNNSEILTLTGDRRMVKDDGTSKRVSLKKGANILRGMIINGPGMSDFCVRFIDESGNPITNFTISNK